MGRVGTCRLYSVKSVVSVGAGAEGEGVLAGWTGVSDIGGEWDR